MSQKRKGPSSAKAGRPVSNSDVDAGAKEVAALNAIFDKYCREHGAGQRADDPDTMGLDATMAFLGGIGVDLEEPLTLCVHVLLGAQTMGEIPRIGFVEGWSAWNVGSEAAMRTQIARWRATWTHDTALFRRVYTATFDLVRPERAARSLPLDIACDYWALLLPLQPAGQDGVAGWPLLATWLDFVKQHDPPRAVSRDTWTQLYYFQQDLAYDPVARAFPGYDPDGAWPVLIDEVRGLLPRLASVAR